MSVNMTQTGTMSYLGRGFHIAGYDVLLTGDTILVGATDGIARRYAVPNHGTAFADLIARPEFRAGWARMADEAEILYFYDRDDDNFGYALNLTAPDCSEWGYAPFA